MRLKLSEQIRSANDAVQTSLDDFGRTRVAVVRVRNSKLLALIDGLKADMEEQNKQSRRLATKVKNG